MIGANIPGCEISNNEVDQYKLQAGDILIARTGGTIGKTFLVRELPVTAVFASYLIRVQKSSEFYDRYLKLFLESPAYWKQLQDGTRGAGQPNVNGQTLGKMTVPVPPLAEQHRIVAKVDELMVLCDRLEAELHEREKRRDRLTAASHYYLNNGANAAALRSYANFYVKHLPTITTRPEQIPDLRRTIVSLAVRGQLIAQYPTDEPASELLKHIQAEKERLIKEGKIGRARAPVPARPDELGFRLRPGWQAARISQLLVELQTGPFGSSLHESDYERGGTPVINPASIKNGRLVPIDSMAIGAATLKRLATFKLRKNDIVMARRGEMGRCGVVTEREDGWLCGTGSLILRLPSCLFPPFLVTLIGSPFVREYLGGSAVGATMQNLNQSILLNLVVGLPPLAEQRRIVAKVEELMALCDRLEAQLDAAQDESRRLLEAVLHDALNDAHQCA